MAEKGRAPGEHLEPTSGNGTTINDTCILASDDEKVKGARDVALLAITHDISTVPPRQDGSKQPRGEWKEYQQRRPTIEEINEWYSAGLTGVGYVCGKVSENLELFEYENRDIYEQFKAAAVGAGLGSLIEKIETGYCEKTPGGGIHWFTRCNKIEGNSKLARRPGPPDKTDKPTTEVLIETRGEGGYAIVAPSNGKVHPSGKPYQLLSGGVATIPTITLEERKALWDLARTFDEMPKKQAEVPQEHTSREGNRPGDEFNQRAGWGEILEPHGWRKVYESNGVTYWRRPGKNNGISATTNHARSDLFYCFSSSVNGFEPETGYCKFSAYAILEHNGDFSTAGKALFAKGFGTLDESINAQQWPDPLNEAALYGLAGDIVKRILPQTEADPAALLVQLLVFFGNVIGRNPHFKVEADYHGTNLNVVLVGATAKGRKGTSQGYVRRLFEHVDSAWMSERVQAGLSSGEGLVWAVRDPIVRQEKNKQSGAFEEVVADAGVEDHRLLASESEFASVLRVLAREGNTLSAVIRQAWDTGDLRIMTKNNPAKATGAHISIIGHITKDELCRYLADTEAGNGFANRFLWACVRRSKCLPEGGAMVDLTDLTHRLRGAVDYARKAGQLRRDDRAREIWYAVYPELSEGKPGLLGAITSRAEAQVMRLACIYALLDSTDIVRAEHLLAALALWEYVEASCKYIFGNALGDPVADEILKTLRGTPGGLTRTEISNIFGRNKSSKEIGRALTMLLEAGCIRRETEESEGPKPIERWYAI